MLASRQNPVTDANSGAGRSFASARPRLIPFAYLLAPNSNFIAFKLARSSH